MLLAAWMNTLYDAFDSLDPLFYSGEWPPRGSNRSFYGNPVVDSLLEYARFEADETEVSVTAPDRDADRSEALSSAPIHDEGVLLLPAQALEAVLGIPVRRDPMPNGEEVLRIGPPETDPEELVEWCRLLGIGNPDAFHASGFRIKLMLPQGLELPEEQEFLLTWRTNADACVQVFEKYEEHDPRPLLGRTEDGEVKQPPFAPEQWDRSGAWTVRRWAQSTPPAGTVWYVAVATTTEDPPHRLLDALASPDAPDTEWAIDAVQVTVTPGGDEEP